MFEGNIVGNLERRRDGLREHGGGGFTIGSRNLQADTSEQIGHLPIEANEIFVFQEAIDSGGLDDGPGDDGLREIAIPAQRNKVAIPGFRLFLDSRRGKS